MPTIYSTPRERYEAASDRLCALSRHACDLAERATQYPVWSPVRADLQRQADSAFHAAQSAERACNAAWHEYQAAARVGMADMGARPLGRIAQVTP